MMDPGARSASKQLSPVLKQIAKSGNVEELKKAIHDPTLRYSDNYGQSMIHLAVEAGHVDMCLYLIVEKKLDVNVQDRNGWTPLHVACSNGDCKAVASLLSTNKCDVTLRTFEGATVLHYLVRREPEEGLHESYFALVQQLIASGCDLEARNCNGETAIHAAAGAGKKGMILCLERNGININAISNYGETCLHLAARRGDLEMVQTLVSLGVDPSIHGTNGTALLVAEEIGHEAIIEFLKDQMKLSSLIDQENLIKEAIESAKTTGRLNLCNLTLSSVPSEAFELTSLTHIDLSHNFITSIPPQICQFTVLKSLRLDANILTTLPKEMGGMGWLEHISLSLNTELDPLLKKKYREGTAVLLEHLQSLSNSKSCNTIVSRKGSIGENILLDLRAQTPEEERLILLLEDKRKILERKEKKMLEAITLIQSKNQSIKKIWSQIKKTEDNLKRREKGLQKLAREVETKERDKTSEKKRYFADNRHRSHQQLSVSMRRECGFDSPISPKHSRRSSNKLQGFDVHTTNENGKVFISLSHSHQKFSFPVDELGSLVEHLSSLEPPTNNT